MVMLINRFLCLPVLILAGFCACSPLQGSSCIPTTPLEDFDRALIVFSGTVVEVENQIEINPNDPLSQYTSYHKKVTFKINALWKGESSDFVDIYQHRHPLLPGFQSSLMKIGESWVIFGKERTSTVEPIYWPEVQYYSNVCLGMVYMNLAHFGVLTALASIKEPVILNNQNPIELDGFPLADKWWFSDWLDTLYIEYYPWVLHRNLEWIFLQSSKEPGSSWIYNTLHGWIWTEADIFPWIWRKQDRTWNYLENPRRTSDGHWLFNQSSDDWVFYEFENIWLQVNNPFTGD